MRGGAGNTPKKPITNIPKQKRPIGFLGALHHAEPPKILPTAIPKQQHPIGYYGALHHIPPRQATIDPPSNNTEYNDSQSDPTNPINTTLNDPQPINSQPASQPGPRRRTRRNLRSKKRRNNIKY